MIKNWFVWTAESAAPTYPAYVNALDGAGYKPWHMSRKSDICRLSNADLSTEPQAEEL